jgi:hypothetical protein
MFSGCENIKSIDLSSIEAPISDMDSAFYECRKLESIKFPSNLDTTNMTYLQNVFYRCESL